MTVRFQIRDRGQPPRYELYPLTVIPRVDEYVYWPNEGYEDGKPYVVKRVTHDYASNVSANRQLGHERWCIEIVLVEP